MDSFQIRQLVKSDQKWVGDFIESRWHSRRMVTRGNLLYPEELDGFVALEKDKPIGLLTYRISNGELEVVTLDSLAEDRGVGSSLLNAAKDLAISNRCRRLWLITTNDNLHALGFYQKWGLQVGAWHRNALEHSRKLKPEIPLIGKNGIPLRDEIEMELVLIP
ncbi:MAG TPA: GNAT family N-acetyltransferase [Candidatus Dormibacteraeota bacterium]|nr:GNAT family N-acetyltransferase [Candidatus Dormibacteraeota bacterium]